MIGRNIAPGLNRKFVSQQWESIPESIWKEEKKKAYGAINYDADLKIYGFDIDKKATEAAAENAAEAGAVSYTHLDVYKRQIT